VLDEINEQTDQMQQIQDAMAQPIGPAADVDEDELMGELEVVFSSFQSCSMTLILLREQIYFLGPSVHGFVCRAFAMQLSCHASSAGCIS